MIDKARAGDDNNAAVNEKRRSRRARGFALMTPERQREVASLGGHAAHKKGGAHQFTTEEEHPGDKNGHQR